MKRRIKPRPCRRRLQGRAILQEVVSYDIEGTGDVPVTAARKFASINGIKSPAVINIRRNDYTVDHFFLAPQGMFGLTYVEFNWMLFPCLKKIAQEKGLGQALPELDLYHWSCDEESYKYEYAFI